MHVNSTRIHFFSHRPLSVLSKSSIAGLIGVAFFSMFMWLTVKDLPFFIIIAAIMVVCAAFIFTGVRWMPFLSSAVCACFLYFLLIPTPFAFNHLAHPKDTDSGVWFSFAVFVIILCFVWCMVLAIGTGISTGIQNYRQRERQTTPRWFSPVLAGMIGLLLGAILITAIAQPSTAAATVDASGNGTIHMSATNFGQTVMTIGKGKKLTLVNDGSFYHVISAGTWMNGQPVLHHSANEPIVYNVEINGAGKSVEIGPFNTAGVYHLYCTVHPGMNLTVIVR